VVARGEVRWLELEEEGRRQVLVLTRDEALPRLRNVVVALVTRTVRGIETEVELGPADGMPVECASVSPTENGAARPAD
jgi:mRNA interferase MazF